MNQKGCLLKLFRPPLNSYYQKMIYELRIYECFAGKLENLNARFRNHTLKLFEKHGITNVGYLVNDVGPSNNTLTYLLSYPSHDARVESWKNFRNDRCFKA